MILSILIIFWLIMAILSFMVLSSESSYDLILFPIVTLVSFIALVLWSVAVIFTYVAAKSDLKIIDEKIATIEDLNNKRVEDIIPILDKYPTLEKEIIGKINPNNFAVIGGVYPELKSDTSYQEQARVLSSNIGKLEKLKMQKLDAKRKMYEVQMMIRFLK